MTKPDEPSVGEHLKTGAKTLGLIAVGLATGGILAPLLAGTAATVMGGVSAGFLIAGGVNSLNHLAARNAAAPAPASEFRDDLAARRAARAAASAQPSRSHRPG